MRLAAGRLQGAQLEGRYKILSRLPVLAICGPFSPKKATVSGKQEGGWKVHF